jgi:hypothetical protein
MKEIDMDCDLQGCGSDTCDSCVRMARQELDPNQLELFDEVAIEDEMQNAVDEFLLGYYKAWLEQPSVLTIASKDSLGNAIPIVRVREDMTLEYGPTYTPDGAARLFWQAIELEGKSLATRLVESVDLVEEYMERAERSSSCYIIADAERDALRRENKELKLRLRALGVK